MPTEVEVKFRADGPEPLARLLDTAELGPAELGATRVAVERDRYLDTADGRLAAARWACRLRTRGGATIVSLKGPAEPGSGAGLHRRAELEGPADDRLEPADWQPSDARDLLVELAGGGDLVERFELAQRRTERPVRVGRREIGTLTLDEVEIRTAGEPRGRFRAVEVELGTDGPDGDEVVLRQVAAALGMIEGLAPEDRTKLEVAVELLGEP